MTHFTPTPEAVDAAAEALEESARQYPGRGWGPSAEVVIAAFVEAEELKVVKFGSLQRERIVPGSCQLRGPWRKRD